MPSLVEGRSPEPGKQWKCPGWLSRTTIDFIYYLRGVMGKTKFDTCFFERYAMISLTSLLGEKYSCLVNEDRPDLQAPDHSLGIEVTRAMEESKKVADSLLLEMAGAYHAGKLKRIRYIYVPSVLPYFLSSLSIALGLAWKSGIAAEVIGLPSGSIGERVYEAKIYLSTPDLFAWTVTVIVMAFLFERFFLFVSSSLLRRAES